MRERSPWLSSPEYIAALFTTATQTFAMAHHFTGRASLPPIGEIEALIKPERSPFIKALLGAYPVAETSEIRLRIGEPSVAPLCQSAEQRFVKSILTGAVRVGVDPKTYSPKLVIKYVGKLVALCVDDFSLPNGQRAIQDHWYMPVDSKTTAMLEEEFKANERSRFELSHGSWALMRPLNLENLRTLASVRKGDPIADFNNLVSSDLFTELLLRLSLPNELTDIDGVKLIPEDFRKRRENFESIYENTDLINIAHADAIASD